MIEHPDPGQSGKRKGPVSGETDQPGITEAPAGYKAPAPNQGGSHSSLDDLREAARAIKGLSLPDWMQERLLAGLVKEHSAAIACELLAGEESQ